MSNAWYAIVFLLCAAPVRAGEGPFLITYTHQMEEPGNLELGTKTSTGRSGGNRWLGSVMELEYGARGWWTTEFYLDAQATAGGAAFLTGYRWENRFHLLPREHWINPVLYLEFENINGADRSLLEVVNHDGEADLAQPVSEVRGDKKREVEAKLILGSYFKGWTLAENFIAEKNLRHEPYEFGYAVGVSRPLTLAARPDRCNLCGENFQLGVEVYGGLGTANQFGLTATSHYVAPVLAWTLANGTTFRASAGFGVTRTSAGLLWRFGASYEIDQFRRSVRRLLQERNRP